MAFRCVCPSNRFLIDSCFDINSVCDHEVETKEIYTANEMFITIVKAV